MLLHLTRGTECVGKKTETDNERSKKKRKTHVWPRVIQAQNFQNSGYEIQSGLYCDIHTVISGEVKETGLLPAGCQLNQQNTVVALSKSLELWNRGRVPFPDLYILGQHSLNTQKLWKYRKKTLISFISLSGCWAQHTPRIDLGNDSPCCLNNLSLLFPRIRLGSFCQK